MKKLSLIVILVISLALGGCAGMSQQKFNRRHLQTINPSIAKILFNLLG